MCAKKKTAQRKVWKLAGEAVRAALTAAEQESVTGDFRVYRPFRGGNDRGIQCVTPAEARVHESAAQAVAAYLCRHYAPRYPRETVVKAVAVTAAIPADLAARSVRDPDFLLGAALWLLDRLEEACEDPDDYLALLPGEANEALDLRLPCALDLTHPWDLVVRTVMVLEGRGTAYRRQFRALLELLGPETAAELRSTFRAAFLDYMDRVLEIYERLRPVARELPEELSQPFARPWEIDPGAENPEVFALIMAPDLICRPAEEIREAVGSRRAAELLADYGTDDPCALCAAYLLLEREGDALASLNALTAAVARCAVRHLPWYQDDLSLRAPLFEAGAPDFRLRYAYRGPSEEDEEVFLETGRRLSEAQLFFLATGVALPRDRRPSEALARWFAEQGVDERCAGELAWAAFMAYHIDENGGEWPDTDPLDEETPPPEEAPAPPPDESACAARLEALTRQAKELRGVLHESERTADRLREQLRRSERQSELDRAELAQLRETLYRLRAGEDEEAGDDGPLVELPFQVERRVVVFGGHDSWAKAVRPLLPGARFYARGALPDLNAIRGADAVWLQTNALSHKFYYRIINTARENGVAVRYFGFASAKKCAEQLAMDELAAQKPG